MADYTGLLAKEVAADKLRNINAVCFDVDSTVCQDEAIDRLAAHCGVGEAVAEWTKKAMGGGVTYQESLAARLDIMKPSLATVQKCIESEAPLLTPGVAEFVALLQSKNIKVYLVTGGFQRLVLPVAKALNIPETNIFSNYLIFDDKGDYCGFDKERFTSRTGGKAEVVASLKKTPGHESVAVIGDGATDMEARPPADLFIGFGGNAVREKVKNGADWFAMSFAELIAAFND
eukprot:m.338594 g.338594  ORF g.338594 m.338594 type:complete len:232 (+) comp18471_c0_seq1:296-991(+)